MNDPKNGTAHGPTGPTPQDSSDVESNRYYGNSSSKVNSEGSSTSETLELVRAIKESLKFNLVSFDVALDRIVKLGCRYAIELGADVVELKHDTYLISKDLNYWLCREGRIEPVVPQSPEGIQIALLSLGFRKGGSEFSEVLIEALKHVKTREGTAIPIEVKHISEREELAYQVAMKVLDELVIKTFYVRGTDKEYTIGIFCYDNGIYVPCEDEIKTLVEKLVMESGEEIAKKTTRWVINEALARIERRSRTRLHYEPLVIAFKNVLFDWEVFLETGSIRKAVKGFSPDIIVFHKIPHYLNPLLFDKLEGLLKYGEELASSKLEEVANALCPKTLKTFKEWVGDKWPLLFEIIGYTLYPRYDMHKAIMLVGEGRNGKSTYLRLLKDILGPHNVSSVSLQDLTDETRRFAVIQLYHKLANIYADLPDRPLAHTGRFKILTGEDIIEADRKFRDPIKFVNYAKLIFSTNQLPPVRDMTTAFWRRWLVIEFPSQFPLDPTFYERTFTKDEIEGTIIVGLLAFRNVWLRRKFSFEETEADYKEKWLREINSVYAFIQDLLQGKIEGYKAGKDPNARVKASELYGIYVEYCNSEDREALPKRQFTIEMERLGFEKVTIKGTRYYKGLSLKKKEQGSLT